MAVSFAVVGLILLSRQGVLWETLPVLRPIAASRLRFVLLAFAVTLGLTAPLTQLRSYASRFITCLIMSFFIAILISFPFLGPALIQSDLAASQTRIDIDGVCRQSQPFTCGPAAAVTALNRFGVQASEGNLAMAAHTSPVIGTSPWDLYIDRSTPGQCCPVGGRAGCPGDRPLCGRISSKRKHRDHCGSDGRPCPYAARQF
jgi:hypothetical protein